MQLSSEELEILKWAIGVPTAVIGTFMIPWHAWRTHLQCKKLSLEVRLLEVEVRKHRDAGVRAPKPGQVLLLAKNYGLAIQMALLPIAVWGGLLANSFVAFLVGMGLSAAFGVAGLVATDLHWKRSIKNLEESIADVGNLITRERKP